MVDVPKKPGPSSPEPAPPTAPTKPSDAPGRMPTVAELEARGFKFLKPTGKDYAFAMPMGRPPAKKD